MYQCARARRWPICTTADWHWYILAKSCFGFHPCVPPITACQKTSMGSTIGEPFLLYSCNTQTKEGSRPIHTTYNPKFARHATLTIQADGIRIVDVRISGFPAQLIGFTPCRIPGRKHTFGGLPFRRRPRLVRSASSQPTCTGRKWRPNGRHVRSHKTGSRGRRGERGADDLDNEAAALWFARREGGEKSCPGASSLFRGRRPPRLTWK